MEFRFLCEKLKQMRIDRGWNQGDVAERANLSPAAISDLEQGKKKIPRAETIEALSEAFDKNPIEFFVNGPLAKEILPKEMNDELVDFILDTNNIEYLQAAFQAKQQEISPSTLIFYSRMEKQRKEFEKQP